MNRTIKPTPAGSMYAAIGLCFALALPVSTLAAPTTYSYVGNAFTRVDSGTLGSHITATVTFASDFSGNEVKSASDIVSWSISTETLSFSSAAGNTLSGGDVFNYQVGYGIREWTLRASGNNSSLGTNRGSTSSVDSAANTLYLNYVQYQPGTWTLGGGPAVTPVPEPASLLLMGAGVAGLLLHRRRAAA